MLHAAEHIIEQLPLFRDIAEERDRNERIAAAKEKQKAENKKLADRGRELLAIIEKENAAKRNAMNQIVPSSTQGAIFPQLEDYYLATARPASVPVQFTCAALASAVSKQFNLDRNSVYNFCVNNIQHISQLPYRKAFDYVKSKFTMPRGKTAGSRKAKNITSAMAGMSIGATGNSVAPGFVTKQKAPVAISNKVTKKSKPKYVTRPDGSMVVTHTEMVGVLLSGAFTTNISAYSTTNYRLNPGVTSLFPWLSSIATNYDKYRFIKLEVGLIPLVGTSYNGRIGIGVDYDSTDVVPANRQEFFALTNHVENSPWEACYLTVKTDNTERFTGTHTSADSKLIDLGQLIAFSDNISNGGTLTSAINVADIVVSYTVELRYPQQALFNTMAVGQLSNFSAANTTIDGYATATVRGPSVITFTKTSSTVLTATVPYGVYVVAMHAKWSSGTPTLTPTFGVGDGNVKPSGGVNLVSGSDLLWMATIRVNSNTVNLILTMSGVTWETNLTSLYFTISRVSPPIYDIAT